MYFASILIFQSKQCWRQKQLCLAPTNVFASMSCLTTKLVYLNIRSPLILRKNHTPYLPQCKVQVCGVVAGWRNINHCVAAQLQIRAIHVQTFPIMGIPCETWELGQIAELVARLDIGNLFRLFEMSVA